MNDDATTPESVNTAIYRERRERLLQTISRRGGGIVIMPTAPELFRNRDTHFPFRAESYFYYLSGFPEPEAALALVCNAQGKTRHILFCRDKHDECEIWEGLRYGVKMARDFFLFDEAFSIDELDTMLPTLLTNQPVLYTPLGLFADWDRRIMQTREKVRAQVRGGDMPPSTLIDVRNELDAMRLIKDRHEIALMRFAAEISGKAHIRAMQKARSGLYEYQIEAELVYEFLKSGAQAVAYPSIVASGENTCVLHYTANRRQMREGDLLLIDAGCEYQYYASDITRTFPVGKRFTAAQKDVYEVVLEAQRACFAALRVDTPVSEYHAAAERVLAQGMIDFKLIEGPLDAALESGSFRRFYMHRAGHWLGMDVHDAGYYRGTGDDQPLKLVSGMVLTVEPGIYIRATADIPAALHNIGIRVEDNVLITKDGIDILTKNTPKTISDIERLRGE
ncbi:MAG: aminopeptidase P N-terminal domain-containing protein [Burkholderiales bacterium]|jgi:Xaa-Pro aminopeptidase|nr:aminopeptidase P N-terminal domain-containing protein [Burkholderiales bacterium]